MLTLEIILIDMGNYYLPIIRIGKIFLEVFIPKMNLNKNYSSNGLTCYAKRYVDSENCYFDNDGVVAIIGTWAYLNDDNPFNLNVIYQDLKSEDKGVDYVRKHLIGSYALAYIQDNKLRIFVDECHTYALYII